MFEVKFAASQTNELLIWTYLCHTTPKTHTLATYNDKFYMTFLTNNFITTETIHDTNWQCWWWRLNDDIRMTLALAVINNSIHLIKVFLTFIAFITLLLFAHFSSSLNTFHGDFYANYSIAA